MVTYLQEILFVVAQGFRSSPVALRAFVDYYEL